MCPWYLNLYDLLENFKGKVENDSGNEEIMSAEGITPQFGKSYPPKESDMIRKMCHYMLSEKRIPQNFECNPQILETYVPIEEQCFYCGTMLNQAEIACAKATLLTMEKVVKNLKTYYKTCSKCYVCYRYHDHRNGIHNFSDNFLIGMDVATFIREFLHQSIPIGSVVKALSERLDDKLKAQTIVNAYLYFECLSQHDYDYYCVLCGYHPTILIMDLNRKIKFKCPLSQLKLPEKYDIADADFVNCDDFLDERATNNACERFPGHKHCRY